MQKLDIQKIETIAKKYFEGASVCHDWSHVERVRSLANFIGAKEGADLEIIEIAALLHDIGRKKEFTCKGVRSDGKRFCHALEGAKEAKRILVNFDIKKEQLENIIHCIYAHRFRNEQIPETLEAKVLFDADKLDSIGAVGVARDFVFVGHFKTVMYTGHEAEHIKSGKNYDYAKEDSAVLEYEKKLKHIKEKMLTKTGREISQERHNFMVKFFNRFWEEVEGEK